jgi:hypothetical protein
MEQPIEILRRLIEAKVEFSLTGGFASLHHGDTLVTQKVEVCARFTPENLRRIESAFKDFHQRHRLRAHLTFCALGGRWLGWSLALPKTLRDGSGSVGRGSRRAGGVQKVRCAHRLTTNKLPLELTDELCHRLKNMYLNTDLGILDCLGEVAGVGDFDAVLRQSQLMDFPFGRCYVLKIDAQMQAKQAVGRPHDLMAVAQLKAIKEKNEQQKTLF